MANKQYTLGRGRVYFDAFVASTTTITGERYFGNTPSFNLNTESENLDHFDADEGIKTKDKSVTLSVNRKGSFVTDNIDPDNVALFFIGNAAVAAQAAAIGKTSVITNPVADRYYQLGVTVGNPSGDRQVDNVVASGSATGFTVDEELGRVYITPGGDIAGDASVTFTYDTIAKSRKQIVTTGNASVEGALRFIAANATGAQLDYYMPSVKLAPNGEYELKGEAWQQMSFTVEIQKRNDDTEAIYIDGRPYTA